MIFWHLSRFGCLLDSFSVQLITHQSCNNALERYWQEFKRHGTMDRILRRFDELIERVSGYGLFGASPSPSVMDASALHARDHNSIRFIVSLVMRSSHRAFSLLLLTMNLTVE